MDGRMIRHWLLDSLFWGLVAWVAVLMIAVDLLRYFGVTT
jgi:hypothetical protein